MSIFKILTFVLAVSGGVVVSVPGVVAADETVANKIKDHADDVDTRARKEVRTVKRKLRNTIGEESALKDMEDRTKGATDAISNKAKKLKRKHKAKHAHQANE